MIEEYSCENKKQLHAKERYWIENIECVNMVIPFRTIKEWSHDNKETIHKNSKEYRENNKQKIQEYFEISKQKIQKQRKIYYKSNK